MDEATKRVIAGVAKAYPMKRQRIMNLKHGRAEASLARYAVYKILLFRGLRVREIATVFKAKPANVAKAIKRYDTWLEIYPVLKANFERIKNTL